MKVRYIGKTSDPLYFICGKVYEKIGESHVGGTMLSVIDETGEDYLYPPGWFEELTDEEAQRIADSRVPHLCPVCGKHVFPMEESYESCPHCNWCDTADPVWNNDLSVVEDREKYRKGT